MLTVAVLPPEEKADPAAGATRPNSFSVGAGAVGDSKS